MSSEDETPLDTDGPLVFARGERERVEGSFQNVAAQLVGQAAILLGWRPSEFWNATPAELATILAAFEPQHTTPPDQKMLHKLLQQFPDD